MTSQTQLHIRPIAGVIGAEVRGVDLKEPIGDNLRATLRSALLDHLVLFFPDQHLENDQMKSFGENWGELVVYDVTPNSDADPGIVELRASEGRTADVWHTDQTFQPDPPMGSVLNLVKAPPAGGDTMWASLYEAYDQLSPPMREFLDGLTAVHELPMIMQRYLKDPNAGPMNGTEHSVVQVHPETGRRFLYVNRLYTSHIRELSRPESDALLGFLFTHSEDPRFMVRYQWTEGTIAIWDNRCTQHCVVNDFRGERIIRRVTIGGEPLVKANSRWPSFDMGTMGARAKLGKG